MAAVNAVASGDTKTASAFCCGAMHKNASHTYMISHDVRNARQTPHFHLVCRAVLRGAVPVWGDETALHCTETRTSAPQR